MASASRICLRSCRIINDTGRGSRSGRPRSPRSFRHLACRVPIARSRQAPDGQPHALVANHLSARRKLMSCGWETPPTTCRTARFAPIHYPRPPSTSARPAMSRDSTPRLERDTRSDSCRFLRFMGRQLVCFLARTCSEHGLVGAGMGISSERRRQC